MLLECLTGGVSQDKVFAVRDKSFWDHRTKTRVGGFVIILNLFVGL